MTRIFDALKKTQARRPEPPGPPAVLAERAGSAAAAYRSQATPMPILVPVAGALPEDVAREIGGLRVGLESALATRPRTVALLASQRGEGTTTIVGQLAQMLGADRDVRVLVIDAHARRPAWTSQRFESARESTGPTGAIHVLPLAETSRATITPAMLRETLDALAGTYDWALVDAPPVLEAPEAAALAAVADGAVLVIHAGRTKRPVLARSVELLGKSGARVLGTVLNRRRLEIPDFIYRRI